MVLKKLTSPDMNDGIILFLIEGNETVIFIDVGDHSIYQ